jgi:hypothetical protein
MSPLGEGNPAAGRQHRKFSRPKWNWTSSNCRLISRLRQRVDVSALLQLLERQAGVEFPVLVEKPGNVPAQQNLPRIRQMPGRTRELSQMVFVQLVVSELYHCVRSLSALSWRRYSRNRRCRLAALPRGRYRYPASAGVGSLSAPERCRARPLPLALLPADLDRDCHVTAVAKAEGQKYVRDRRPHPVDGEQVHGVERCRSKVRS